MRIIIGTFKYWMRLMRWIGNVQARLMLSLIYLVLVLPMGLVAQRVADPLNRRGGPGWHSRKQTVDSDQASRRQY